MCLSFGSTPGQHTCGGALAKSVFLETKDTCEILVIFLCSVGEEPVNFYYVVFPDPPHHWGFRDSLNQAAGQKVKLQAYRAQSQR